MEKPDACKDLGEAVVQTKASKPPPNGGTTNECEPKPIKMRKDKSRLHTTRHAVLSRFPLEALERLGENVRSLRRIERELRNELKPSGIMGTIWFDRLWSSYLRCLLAARAESTSFISVTQSHNRNRSLPSLREADTPVLVYKENECSSDACLSGDVFRNMILIERYDRHFSREMYRALQMLIFLRDGGTVDQMSHIGGLLKRTSESEE